MTGNESRSFTDGPRLLADIGGTNARFALELAPGAIGDIEVLPCSEFAGIREAVEHYLSRVGVGQISRGAIAIANPVDGDTVRMTNHHWAFSVEETRRALGLRTLTVVNDFTALAMALPKLCGDDWIQVGAGVPHKDAPIGLVGPGTGLGVSGLVRSEGQWVPLESEGGHITFSPADEREDVVLRYARRLWGHVSFERIAAGPGLGVIFDALASIKGENPKQLTPVQVTDLAHNGNSVAQETICCFSRILGSFAGNLALTLGAKGGVFVGGGVVGRLGATFDADAFRLGFESKGRFQGYLEAIPTYIITAEYPAFRGVSAILAAACTR